MSWTAGDSTDGGLIYKSRDDARVMQQQSDPWAGWNNWCDARINNMLEESFGPDGFLNHAIAEFVVEYVRKRLNAETAKLCGQIADLKVEIAALKSEVQTLRADNVVPIGKNKCRLILPNG